jgi:DNA-binding winged helix-turn-helix (wHTH) protein
LERAGEVVSHEELMEQAWPDVTVAESNLRVQIGAIRKMLGDGRDGARYIANVAGRGYSFVATVHRLRPLALNGTSEQWSREHPRLTFCGSFQWSCQTYGYQKANLSDANRH